VLVHIICSHAYSALPFDHSERGQRGDGLEHRLTCNIRAANSGAVIGTSINARSGLERDSAWQSLVYAFLLNAFQRNASCACHAIIAHRGQQTRAVAAGWAKTGDNVC